MKNIKEHEKQIYQAVVDGELEIDSQGRVWRVAKRQWNRWGNCHILVRCRRVRAEHPTPGGYLQVRVMYRKVRYYTSAHRLVYMHFKGPIPPGMTVNHENGVKPDNRPSNLELMTHSEQAMHARHVLKVGRIDQDGEKNAMAKLTREDVVSIRQRRLSGEPLKSIAPDFGISDRTVSKIARGQRWRIV